MNYICFGNYWLIGEFSRQRDKRKMCVLPYTVDIGLVFNNHNYHNAGTAFCAN